MCASAAGGSGGSLEEQLELHHAVVLDGDDHKGGGGNDVVVGEWDVKRADHSDDVADALAFKGDAHFLRDAVEGERAGGGECAWLALLGHRIDAGSGRSR